MDIPCRCSVILYIKNSGQVVVIIYFVTHGLINLVLIYQDLILKACANLAYFIWNHELLPLDILLLALIDRDDDPHALRIVVCDHKYLC